MNEITPDTLILAVCAGLSVFCGAWLTLHSAIQAHAEVGRYQGQRGKGTSSLGFKLVLPFARWFGFLLGSLASRIEMRSGRDASKSFILSTRVRIEKRLRAAGHPEGVTPDEYFGLCVAGLFIGAAVGAVVYLRMQVPAAIIVGALFGALWPGMWLNKRLRLRRSEISHELPYALDLLTLSVEAGLDFTEALDRIVHKLGVSPLAEELGATLRDIRLGRTRTEALRNLSHRVDMGAVTSVASALIQADELGSSLGPILRAQSEQLRVARSQEAEKKALEAPVKILFPLIFFILPTIFLIIGGPIYLKYAL